MRRKGQGHIRQRDSGRFNARVMGFGLGMFDTWNDAERGIKDFLNNRCPLCRQKINATTGPFPEGQHG